jgi:hypothetical protein
MIDDATSISYDVTWIILALADQSDLEWGGVPGHLKAPWG